MAISWVANAENSGAGGADVTLTLPTGSMQVDDLILVAYALGDADNVALNQAMVTTGYTEVFDIDNTTDDQDSYLGVFYKFWNGTDTTAVVDGVGGTDTSVAAVCMIFRGVATVADGGPFTVAGAQQSGTDGAHPDPPSLDHPATAGTWTVIAGCSAHLNQADNAYTFPTGYTTNKVDRGQSATETTYCTVGMGYNSSPSDPENPGVMTHPNSAATNSWIAVTMALMQAPPPPPGNLVSSAVNFAEGGGSGSITAQHYAGPFIDTNGNLYLVLADGTNTNELEVWKSANGGSTWAEQNAASSPNNGSGDLYGVWGYQFGTMIYVVTAAGSGSLYFHTFRTSDHGTPDTWATIDKLIVTLTDAGGEGFVSMVVTDANHILVLGPGENTNGWERVDRYYSTDGGANWSTNQQFCDRSQTYDNDTGILGYIADSGTIMGVYRVDDSDPGVAYARTMTAVDATPGSQFDIADYVFDQENAIVANGLMPAYMDGADEVFVWVNLAITTMYPRSVYVINGSPQASVQIAATAVWKGGGWGAGTHHRSGMSVARDGKDVYVIYADAATRDIWWQKNTDNGGWGSATELADGTNVEALSAAIYERAGYIQLGVAYEQAAGTDPGTNHVRFIEYQIRAAATVVTGQASLSATADIAAAGMRVHIRSVAIEATADIAVDGLAILQRSAAIEATADIIAAGIVVGGATTWEAAASLDATADIAASAIRVHPRSVAIDATADIAAAGVPVHVRSVAVSATADIAASAIRIHVRSVAIDATADIAAAGQRVHLRSVALDATADIIAAGEVGGVIERSVAVSAIADIAATGQAVLVRSVAIDAVADIAAAGQVETPGGVWERSASLDAVADIAVGRMVIANRSAAIDATAGIAAAGYKEVSRSVAIEATADIAVDGLAILQRSVSLDATADIAVAGQVEQPGLVERSASLSATADVSVSNFRRDLHRSASFDATADIAVAGHMSLFRASVSFEATADIQASGRNVVVKAAAEIGAVAGIDVAGRVVLFARAADITATAGINATGIVGEFGAPIVVVGTIRRMHDGADRVYATSGVGSIRKSG